jgi:N-acyl-D-amino-acid deacylase
MTILIKNVEILGGVRKFDGFFDVFINKGKISAIGNFPGKKADKIIDGSGMQLAPGFIDVNSTSDHHLSIFTNPSQEDFLAQGVTTIIGGQSGFSLAPFFKNIPKSLGYFTNENQINFDWQTTGEFLKILGNKKLGVNFGTLTGYENLIFSFSRKGEFEAKLISKKSLNKKDITAVKNLLDKSIHEGSFGISVEKGAPVIPAPTAVIKELLQTVKKDNALISFHFDECHELKRQIKEIIDITKGKNIKIILSHFLPLLGFEKDYEEALGLLNESKNHNIYFDFFPINENLLPIVNFLPKWLKESQELEPSRAIRDPWLQSKILKELPDFNPQELKIAQAFKFDFLVGKTFQELMETFSLPPKEMMLKIMVLTGLKATIDDNNINLYMSLK